MHIMHKKDRCEVDVVEGGCALSARNFQLLMDKHVFTREVLSRARAYRLIQPYRAAYSPIHVEPKRALS